MSTKRLPPLVALALLVSSSCIALPAAASDLDRSIDDGWATVRSWFAAPSAPRAQLQPARLDPCAQSGLTSGQLMELQRRLATLPARPVDPGMADGQCGPNTIDAVKAYQRLRGLRPDGVPTAMLLQRLRDDGVATAPRQRAAKPADVAATDPAATQIKMPLVRPVPAPVIVRAVSDPVETAQAVAPASGPAVGGDPGLWRSSGTDAGGAERAGTMALPGDPSLWQMAQPKP